MTKKLQMTLEVGLKLHCTCVWLQNKGPTSHTIIYVHMQDGKGQMQLAEHMHAHSASLNKTELKRDLLTHLYKCPT